MIIDKTWIELVHCHAFRNKSFQATIPYMLRAALQSKLLSVTLSKAMNTLPVMSPMEKRVVQQEDGPLYINIYANMRTCIHNHRLLGKNTAQTCMLKSNHAAAANQNAFPCASHYI
jgi:hypothetical protein